LVARETASFENAIDQIRQEVRDAVATLDGLAGQNTMRETAVAKTITELESLRVRRQFYPDEFDQITQLYLREYLDALQRRAAAEQALVGVHVDYAVAIIQLRRTVGMLLGP